MQLFLDNVCFGFLINLHDLCTQQFSSYLQGRSIYMIKLKISCYKYLDFLSNLKNTFEFWIANFRTPLACTLLSSVLTIM